MARTSHFDVIVVGTDPAAVLAACALRRQNHRVLLVGQGGPTDSYGHDGTPIPALPALLPPYGHAPLLDHLLGSLALEDPVHQLGLDQDNHLQLVTPRYRLDLSAEPDALSAELRRGAPQQEAAVLEMIERLHAADLWYRELSTAHPSLPPQGWRARLRLKRWEQIPPAALLPPLAEWPTLLRILAAATSFTSRLDCDTRNPAATAHLVLGLLGGMRLVPDWSQRLLDAAQRAGAELDTRRVVEEVQLDGRAAVGVRTLRSADTATCEAMVVGLPVAELADLVPLRQRKRGLRLVVDSVRPLHSVFVVNLVVPLEALPLGMARQVLLVSDPESPLLEDNLVRLLCLPFPARQQRVQLSLACLVPYRQRSLGREYLGPLQQKMFQAAAWLIPFLTEHLEGLSSPFWDSRAGDSGHPSPWLLHRTLETDAAPSLGLAALPVSTPVRNLWLCGPENVAGLDVEGDAWAALDASRQIAEQRKLKKIL